jgi:HEAT repeat protein
LRSLRRNLLGAFLAISIALVPSTGDAGGVPIERQIARLTALLRKDSSSKVRAYAAKQLGAISALGAQGNPEAISALLAALEDREPTVRSVAAGSLGKHKDHESLGRLTRLSADRDRLVRDSATRAIQEIRGAPPTSAPHDPRLKKIELGKVSFDVAGGRTDHALGGAVEEVVQDLLEPHRPLRDNAELRLEVVVRRVQASTRGPRIDVTFEARVLLLELPRKALRHAARATAKMQLGRVDPGYARELEQELAVAATMRAVTEALALLD